MSKRVVLFDGDCGMCSSFVRFVLTCSTDESIIFVALQSERGKALLKEFCIDPALIDSIVFTDGYRAWIYSDAIAEIARSFKFPFSLIRFISVIPRFVRDAGYRVVARYRRRLFRTSQTCQVPTKAERDRIFLD